MSPSFDIYMKLQHPLIRMVIRKCVFLNIANKDIIVCWVPSHVGIWGNEKGDSAAKSTLDLPRAKVGVPYTDFKHLINQYIFSIWQNDWNGAVVNKLHSVKPVLGDWQSSYRRCRKDDVESYIVDPFIHPKEGSSTSVYSDSSTHFG